MLGRAKPTSSAAEREQEEREADVAPPGAGRVDDAREHVEVRVADGVAARPPLDPAVGEHEQRQQHQPEQEQGRREGQLGPLAHTACTCSSTRTADRARDVRANGDLDPRVPARRAVARTEPSAARAGGRSRAEADRRREGEQPLALEARVRRPLRCTSCRRTFFTRRIVASTTAARPPSAAASARARARAPAAAAGGDAAEQRPEARERRASSGRRRRPRGAW